MSEENKITSLSFLKIYASNNTALIRQLVESFLSKTPEIILQLDEQLTAQDLHAFSRTAHSLKPQLSYMGIKAAEPMIVFIEEKAKDGSDKELIKSKLEEIKQLLGGAYSELKEELNQL